LSKNRNEIEASTIETRYVLKVRSATKVAYVSIEVLTKAGYLSTLILIEQSPRSSSVFHYQIPTKERVIQTF
jgi:hypothetical protein